MRCFVRHGPEGRRLLGVVAVRRIHRQYVTASQSRLPPRALSTVERGSILASSKSKALPSTSVVHPSDTGRYPKGLSRFHHSKGARQEVAVQPTSGPLSTSYPAY
ncbi:MAG: hypothetical protein FRX48_07502 [Lasallia pustulata]|uniref:Uncharacterized protein n=1 Tax=Lasallia pustulata TaxID=136370 RepID=A0A5M8PHM2_9LECA|nr:MAG: hypothetical protein FRX48_07502 [Lasallia pustulata]